MILPSPSILISDRSRGRVSVERGQQDDQQPQRRAASIEIMSFANRLLIREALIETLPTKLFMSEPEKRRQSSASGRRDVL
jgi:hypothetical protein